MGLLRRRGAYCCMLALAGVVMLQVTGHGVWGGDLKSAGNLSCPELLVWLGTEKHYSNDKRTALFAMTKGMDCAAATQASSALRLESVQFEGSAKVFSRSSGQCTQHDDLAVVLLSNFSINNNYSHFLHALLRLFCALVDSGLIVWNADRSGLVRRGHKFTLWMDNNLKLTAQKRLWLQAVIGDGGQLRALSDVSPKECVSASMLVYGSGCAFLLPPEKWFGYPGCRASSIVPAFSLYMKQALGGHTKLPAVLSNDTGEVSLAFAVRAAGDETGQRAISNLGALQAAISRRRRMHYSVRNVTFESMSVSQTVAAMSGLHMFVSVHGAGMTNMFFMNPGAAVIEVIPWPLCHCRSPDYFYGTGGYYHGQALALGLRYHAVCVSSHDVKWHAKPAKVKAGVKCSWRQLHAVESVAVDPHLLMSVVKGAERELAFNGVIKLHNPLIELNPNANG